MTLQELGNLGEFIAATGLMFSLIFVGLEVRHSRKASLVEGVENRMSAWNEWSRLLLTNPDLRNVYRNGSRDLDSLDEEEKFVFHELMTLRYTLLIRQFHRGVELNDQESLDGVKGILLQQFSFEPSGADWWRQHRSEFRPAFRNYVDEALTGYEQAKT